MRPNFTEIIFVLDRSGSMYGLEKDVIEGFNGMIERQKKVEGEAAVTTIMFDNRYETLYRGVKIADVPPLTEKQYFARGATALLDAIGRAIDETGRRLSATPEDERPSKVIVAINTDGLENSSTQYSLEKVKSMIELQQSVYSWEFLFLGADIDAVGTACSLGIPTENAAELLHTGDEILAGSYLMDDYITCRRSEKDYMDLREALKQMRR